LASSGVGWLDQVLASFTRSRGTTRIGLRSGCMPPLYRDPALLLLVATAAATAFFAVYVAM